MTDSFWNYFLIKDLYMMRENTGISLDIWCAILFPIFFLALVVALDKCNRAQSNHDEIDEREADGATFDGAVVTLVHGTWGRGMFCPSGDAPWTTEESTLCKSLKTPEHLGPSTIFRRFRWSGKNRHKARSKAANELHDYLARNFNSWPKAKHFVVAHSHGGNVALYAMNDANLREKIAGVVCLATPFILVRERDWGGYRMAVIFTTVLLPVLVVAMFNPVGMLLLRFGLELPEKIGAALSIMIIGLAIGLLTLWSLGRVRIVSDKLQQELTPMLPTPDRVLIVRSPADEASGFLGVFQFLAQMIVRISLYPQVLSARYEHLIGELRPHKWALSIALVGCVMLAKQGFDIATSPNQPLHVLIECISGIIGIILIPTIILIILPLWGVWDTMAVVRFIANLCVLLATAILSLLMIPFGLDWDLMPTAFFLDVTVDATPIGSWGVHLFNAPTAAEYPSPMPPMAHMTYENPRVIEKLGEWMKRRRLVQDMN